MQHKIVINNINNINKAQVYNPQPKHKDACGVCGRIHDCIGIYECLTCSFRTCWAGLIADSPDFGHHLKGDGKELCGPCVPEFRHAYSLLKIRKKK